ncbi:MAG TPA: AraC family transcriptional regulator [Bacteroidales bacterium]|nr:AraC family transcriptional regulator [Bacteroidales bacterium]
MIQFRTISPDKSVSLFVKEILIYEDTGNHQKATLPFFADGFPGLMFHETEHELWVSPHNKQMPPLFLYGQTLKPIELIITGNYKLIVFQLYPFVLKSLFRVDPQTLNDNCYDLIHLENNIGADTIRQLNQTHNLDERIQLITTLLLSLFTNKQKELDLTITRAIKKILDNKGILTIKELYNDLHMTERTFERRFLASVGVTAKQFSKIIRFQQSLEQINVKDHSKLTDIVYANGFADQSHFIKVFKAFTGRTPLAYITKVILSVLFYFPG